MKKIFTFLFLIGAAIYAKAQDTHTLQHIPPEEATETPNYWGQTGNGQPLWGYYIGHNAYGDEEFGEKYEVDHGDVVGIMAYFGGTVTSDNMASLKLYSVAENGLPDELLASKSFMFSEVSTDGVTPTLLTFDEEIHVHDEFFVTLDLGDYSHDPLEGDTLVLMMGPDGSRPASDDVFGRNVIRWHSHGAVEWKDFQTQNFTPWSTYFAIYPVMEGAPLSINDGFIAEEGITMFPVPCVNELNVRFNALETREAFVRVFNMDGKILQNERFMVTSGENLVQFDVSAYAAGAYVVSVEAEGFRYARVISK